MKRGFLPSFALLCAALVAGCSGTGSLGSISLWPFGQDRERERSRTPQGATAYQCPGGRQFYVRNLENGNAVWLTLPDRDLRLERDRASQAVRYSRANTTLEIDGSTASVSDGPEAYKACARA